MKAFNARKSVHQGVRIGILVFAIVGFVTLSQARDLNVRIQRWLTLRNLNGQVTLLQAGNARPAQTGDRLQSVGDGVKTGSRSSVAVVIDSGIGQVDVAEKTQLNIRELRVASNGGKITRLVVTQGQVRLKVRPFTNPDSKLEMETPSGVAGVRGTEFGVAVQSSGKMSLATLQGSVASTAQGQSIPVNEGFQNFTIPGEPPSEPVPLTDNPELLDYEFVKSIEGNLRGLRLIGQVDPVNLVLADGVEQNTDRNGRFEVTLKAVSFPRVRLTVVTPLGSRKEYALALP